jgi:hypothetical protein
VIRTLILSKAARSSVLVVFCAALLVFALTYLPPFQLGFAALVFGGPLSLAAAISTSRAPRHRVATFLLALMVFAYAFTWWVLLLDGCHDQGPCREPWITQLPSYAMLLCILAGPVVVGVYLIRNPARSSSFVAPDEAMEPRL